MTLNTLPRRRYAGLLAVLALALPIAVSAHTAWLVPVDAAATWKLQFGGHQGRLEPAVADKLRQVSAIDAQGQALPVRRTQDGADITLAVDGQPALLALHYDNGIHTRTGRGPSVERPMNEVTGAVSAVNALKYGKTVVRWSPVVTRALGQPFEVIPLDAEAPRAGRPLRVQVLRDGKPVAGIPIGHGEDTGAAVTDAEGMAEFVPVAGLNKLWAGQRSEVDEEPRYTQLSYEYLLVFEAR